jgi:hypothetical protein
MTAGGIAVEHLQQKQPHNDDGIEESVPPSGIADLLTGVCDGVLLELGLPIRFESHQHCDDAGRHPSTPCMRAWLQATSHRRYYRGPTSG